MKALLVLILVSLPSMSSAAEYLDVECYIAEGTTVTKTFDGYVYGSVKTVGNRVIVEGRNIETDYEYRGGTPATCKASSERDADSYYGTRNIENTYVLAFDYSTVELSCAAGSVVKKFGDLKNFTKAIQAQIMRNTHVGNLPYCLDMTGLE